MAATSGQRGTPSWPDEQNVLLCRLKDSNMSWDQIAKHFKGKTGNACRKRWERYVKEESLRAKDWPEEKRVLLAENYFACREKLWADLASTVNEPWELVEREVNCTTIPT